MGIRARIKEVLFEIRLAWQRVWYGYDDTFWWDMDCTFVEIYLKLIKKFKNNLHSCPYKMTEKEWKNILGEMAKFLEKMYNDDGDWVGDKEIEAKNEFFQLFSKYFYDLWD